MLSGLIHTLTGKKPPPKNLEGYQSAVKIEAEKKETALVILALRLTMSSLLF